MTVRYVLSSPLVEGGRGVVGSCDSRYKALDVVGVGLGYRWCAYSDESVTAVTVVLVLGSEISSMEDSKLRRVTYGAVCYVWHMGGRGGDGEKG